MFDNKASIVLDNINLILIMDLISNWPGSHRTRPPILQHLVLFLHMRKPNLALFPLPWWQPEGCEPACGDFMDNTKLKNVIKKYQQHLVVDHGIGRNTVDGYAQSLSIALRRMRKFAPKPAEIKQHILWMHTRVAAHLKLKVFGSTCTNAGT